MVSIVIAVAVIAALTGFVVGVQVERRQKPDGNLYRWDLAQHLYGKQAMRRMVECDESHLPGDCPLCGAV
jgi:hypothetical protein